MPITADRITRLRGFGLSEYAARAYLALLDLGTTEARDISALSKVPASKIYHILEQLHEKGLVVILPEFPRKYAPVPFEDHLQRIHDEHEAAARSIREDRASLAETFAVVGKTSGGDRGSATLLKGRRNVRERVLELLATARSDALILPSVGGLPLLEAADAASAAARARGVRVRVLDEAAPGDRRRRPSAIPDPVFAVAIDGRTALLGQALPDDGHPAEGNDTAIVVDQEGIVALIVALLESQWDGARRPHAVPVEAAGKAASPVAPQAASDPGASRRPVP